MAHLSGHFKGQQEETREEGKQESVVSQQLSKDELNLAEK